MNDRPTIHELEQILQGDGGEVRVNPDGSIYVGTWKERTEIAEALNADLLKALQLILPLAKGYASAHRVGSNAEYILFADTVLSKAEMKDDESAPG